MPKFTLHALVNYREGGDAENSYPPNDLKSVVANIERIINEEPESTSFVFTVVPKAK